MKAEYVRFIWFPFLCLSKRQTSFGFPCFSFLVSLTNHAHIFSSPQITPTQFLESINAINELLISAHSLRHSFWYNTLATFTLQLSRLVATSHHEKVRPSKFKPEVYSSNLFHFTTPTHQEMLKLQYLFDDLNTGLYNPVGLNLLWPRAVAFLFVSTTILRAD